MNLFTFSNVQVDSNRLLMAYWLACLPPMWKVVSFLPRPGHTKDHHKNGTNCLPAGTIGKAVGSAARLC